VTTHTAVTNAQSRWAIKIRMSTADAGEARIEAFFDGENKYGADHTACLVPVF
jgi:hypothetical protein